MTISSSVVKDGEDVRKGIAEIVGEGNVAPPSETISWVVDGRVPKVVAFPDKIDEVSRILAFANKNNLSVVPAGSGTKIGLGGIPRGVDVLISLLRLNKVTEYEPTDLVVTAEAGLKLAELEGMLAKEGQWLPLDPPYRDAATLGGVISSNSAGPLRHRFGSCRDWLLGVKIVTASGEIVKFGGKVVKNVAGYDIKKLFIGSMGSLGVVAETTFRLYPLMPGEQTLVASFTSLKDAAGFVIRIVSSDLLPYTVEALSPESWGAVAADAQVQIQEATFAVALRFGDVEESVKKQLSVARELSRSSGAVDCMVLDRHRSAAIWDSVRDLPLLFQRAKPLSLTCKVSVPASRFLDCSKALEQLAAKREMAFASSSHAGIGILHCYLWARSERDCTEHSAQVAREARDLVLGMGGTLTIEKAPTELKEKVDVWGPTRSDFELMRALKEKFDPRNVLSPGRFIGGI